MYTEKKNTLYIDAANLILTAKDFNLKYNIYWMLEYFKFRYKVNRVIYFTGKIDKLLEDCEFIKKLGVEIVFKEIYREEDGKTKANCDVEISHRITYDLEYNLVDKVILMTGDGDFYSLLKYIEHKNKEVKLIGIHRKTTSRLYKEEMKFNLSYFTEILDEVNLSRPISMALVGMPKGENPVGPLVPTRLFLDIHSITPPENLSIPKQFLEKEYIFQDFLQSMNFVNEVAKIAEEMQHHPEIEIKYNVVEIETTTHDAVNIVTEKDIELIRRIDEIYQNFKN